jgi:hypothetical protein
MKIFKKLYWLILPSIMIISLIIMDRIFNIDNFFITGGLAGLIGFILSPRKKKIKTQTGEKTQITWIFLKESIIIE